MIEFRAAEVAEDHLLARRLHRALVMRTQPLLKLLGVALGTDVVRDESDAFDAVAALLPRRFAWPAAREETDGHQRREGCSLVPRRQHHRRAASCAPSSSGTS